jgi:hypothetical protein
MAQWWSSWMHCSSCSSHVHSQILTTTLLCLEFAADAAVETEIVTRICGWTLWLGICDWNWQEGTSYRCYWCCFQEDSSLTVMLFVDSNTSACKIPFLNTKQTWTHCKRKFNKTPPKFNNQENQQTNNKEEEENYYSKLFKSSPNPDANQQHQSKKIRKNTLQTQSSPMLPNLLTTTTRTKCLQLLWRWVWAKDSMFFNSCHVWEESNRHMFWRSYLFVWTLGL